jgi:hypothetical protein
VQEDRRFWESSTCQCWDSGTGPSKAKVLGWTASASRPSSRDRLADAMVTIGDYAVGGDAAAKNRLRPNITAAGVIIAAEADAQVVDLDGSFAHDEIESRHRGNVRPDH